MYTCSLAELYKMISSDKTEEERLAALHRICLEVSEYMYSVDLNFD